MTTLTENDTISPDDNWDDALKSEIVANEMNGRVGQQLLSETDEVRIWSIAVPPGERVGFHRHVLNYFWVAINAGRSRSHYANGETREAVYEVGTTKHFVFEKGEFMLHDLENIGETELKFTTVEFKNSPNSPLSV